MTGTIVVTGSINVDLVAHCERLPVRGETVAGLDFHQYPGGKGANQAVAVARLGTAVTLVGCVGADESGARLIRGLQDSAVNADLIRTVPGPSGTAMIVTESSGANSIVVIPGANAQVSPAYITDCFRDLSQPSIVMAQLEIPMESVMAAAREARRLGALFILDPAPACALPRELLQQVDWLTPNASEAAVLLDEAITDPDPKSAVALARKLRSTGAHNVLLKLGESGLAVAAAEDQVFHVPAFDIVAKDTTAAGDALNAGFAVALCQGLALEETARFASAVAAISVTRSGAQPSMPTADEVQLFLQQHAERIGVR